MIGDYAVASREQALEAVAAAHAAFPAWSLSTPSSALTSWTPWATKSLPARPSWATCWPEEGKTLPEAIGEVGRAAAIFKFFAGAKPCAPGGEVLPSVRPGVGVEITREPLGVIGLITPWNFPIAIPAWKIARPWPTATPWCSSPRKWCLALPGRWRDILHRAGLPCRRVQPGDGPWL